MVSAESANGQMTFYSPDVGASACGPVYPNDSKVVAVSFVVFGDGSLCGKTVTATYNGVTATAIDADKCAGCSDNCTYPPIIPFQSMWEYSDMYFRD